MAGGVALNCVANGKLLRRGTFKDIWIQPAAGDAGGALGAALAAWHIWQGQERQLPQPGHGQYAGRLPGAGVRRRRDRPAWPGGIRRPIQRYQDFDELAKDVAALLAQGQVVGWFQGRMELGPRALGNRSILGDPRHPEMQKRLNLKIKYREGFRPFAPVGAARRRQPPTSNWTGRRPTCCWWPRSGRKGATPCRADYENLDLFDRLYHLRSDVPAITHVDYSARIQTVHQETNDTILAADQGLSGVDRLRPHRQHQLQRPGRAHRLHPGGRLPVLHAHRNGLPGAGGLSVRQARPARLAGNAGLAQEYELD